MTHTTRTLRIVAVAIAAFFVLGACLPPGSEPSVETPVPPPPPVATTTTSPSLPSGTTLSPVATTTTTTLAPPSGTLHVTVVSVTDGDTIDVLFDDATKDTVRLIGVNSPERGECYAQQATNALEALLTTSIVMTTDTTDRDRFGRLLRYLWLDDGTFVNEALVLGGYAKARDFPPNSRYASQLAAAQIKAETAATGLWAPEACGLSGGGDLRIGHIEYDAPGNDNQNRNGEWVVITNHAVGPHDMTGWVLKDETARHRFQFPSGFVLGPGSTVSVYTGCGTDTATKVYWCNRNAVWNNDGDTAFLLDDNGNITYSKSY